MSTINNLSKNIGTYLQLDQVKVVQNAYHFSAQLHKGQRRASGEPYIHHPLAVASILGSMRMDYQTLIAAILHDTIEDTPIVKNEIKKRFGKGVAELVDGVSKLDRVEFNSFAEAQANNFRKMLMAMSNDIRIILVKLADRLHNMRTLESLKPQKRYRIARETLEVYAPIALRLGINSMRLELEDLSFTMLHPMRSRILSQHINKARGHRKEIITKIRTALKRRMRQEKIPAKIQGREKHLYGIYQKMRDKHCSFSDLYDVYAFRIIVDSVDTCYRVVGIVHNFYRPIPGKLKDYIAIPKANGYQSLHTTLFSPYGFPIEIQIRTPEMNDVAEVGIAAHWLYKTNRNIKKVDRSSAHRRAHEWLRNIVEINKTAGNPEEFFENFKIDLFPDDVYIFTPKGKILELPKGSTAVDFAYAIHTDIGNKCVGARINRKLAPLGTQLVNGQTVEIITSESAKPNPAWLNFVVTAKSRTQIKHFLKHLQHREAVAFGKRLLNRELELFSINYSDLNTLAIKHLLVENKIETEEILFKEIGLGNCMAPLIARQMIALKTAHKNSDSDDQTKQLIPLSIKGSEEMVMTFPKCCYPIPGDPIHGFITSGRGIVVHRQNCNNTIELRGHPEKWVDINWGADVLREFQVKIRINVRNQRGVLANVATTITDANTNIDHVEIQERDDRYISLAFVLEVKDRTHLAQVIKKIKNLKNVSYINRL